MDTVKEEKCDFRWRNQQNENVHHTSMPRESANKGTRFDQFYLRTGTSCDPTIMDVTAPTKECAIYNRAQWDNRYEGTQKLRVTWASKEAEISHLGCDHLTSCGKHSLSTPRSWKEAWDYKQVCRRPAQEEGSVQGQSVSKIAVVPKRLCCCVGRLGGDHWCHCSWQEARVTTGRSGWWSIKAWVPI